MQVEDLLYATKPHAGAIEKSASQSWSDVKKTAEKSVEPTDGVLRSISIDQPTYQKNQLTQSTVADHLEDASSFGGDARAMKNQMVLASETMSDEDYQRMSEEGFLPMDQPGHTIVTVSDKIKKQLAIAGADIPETLKTSRLAKDMKIGDSILIGNEEKIRKIAAESDIDISDFQIVNLNDRTEISRYAVKLVHDGDADMYVKGNIETRDVLKAVLDNEIGLKQVDELISLVGVFEIDGKMKYLTDPSVIPYPDLKEKVQLINNAVKFAKSTGLKNPKVAAVAAISIPNPRMPETMEAEQLSKMSDKGLIKDCIVDGPLSLDLAISPESAKIKHSERKINGDADIILFPDVHAANIAYKILTHLSDAKSGNIIIGTKQPVILSSRSDTVQVKLNSIILGFTYDKFKEHNK